MALLDDILNGGDLTTGLMVGAGVLIAWPLVGSIARPLANGIIKGGLLAYREGERLFSAVAEGVGDLIAEAQEELSATAATSLSNAGAPSEN